MATMIYRVYGADGRRQAQSFGKTETYNFSGDNYRRIITVFRQDVTGTNDYVIVSITRNTYKECETEMLGQLSDGIFENCRVGLIEESRDIEKKFIKRYMSIGPDKVDMWISYSNTIFYDHEIIRRSIYQINHKYFVIYHGNFMPVERSMNGVGYYGKYRAW